MMTINFDINLTRSQRQAYDIVHDPKNTYCVFRWSRQCGKTVFAEIILIESLCSPNTKNVYISPTYSQGAMVFKEIVRLLEGKGILKKSNAGNLSIETVFGSSLEFFSMQSPNSIRGHTVRGVLILDECAFFPDTLPDASEPWSSIIYPIVKANIKRNKVLAISTPKGTRGTFYQFHINCVKQLRGWQEFTATIYDDDLISANDIEALKENMTPLAFREEFMVEFIEGSTSYFQGYDKCFDLDEYDEDDMCFGGVDFSTSGTDDTVLTFVNTKKQVQSLVITGSLDEKYMKIAKIVNSRNCKKLVCEANSIGLPMLNEIRKRLVDPSIVVEFWTSNATKEEIIGELSMDISKHDIHFVVTDTKLRLQLQNFGVSYSKTGKARLLGNNNSHDDTVLSLAFALYGYNLANMTGAYSITFNRNSSLVYI